MLKKIICFCFLYLFLLLFSHEISICSLYAEEIELLLKFSETDIKESSSSASKAFEKSVGLRKLLRMELREKLSSRAQSPRSNHLLRKIDVQNDKVTAALSSSWRRSQSHKLKKWLKMDPSVDTLALVVRPWRSRKRQVERLCRELQKAFFLESCEEDVKLSGSDTQNICPENLVNQQWGLENDGGEFFRIEENQTTENIDIDALSGWSLDGSGSRLDSYLEPGEGVIIGIVDSGIDNEHVDLRDQIWINKAELRVENGKYPATLDSNNDNDISTGEILQFISDWNQDGSVTLRDLITNHEDNIFIDNIDDDLNGYPDDLLGWNFVNDSNDIWDDNGHGSHVAGIAAGDDNCTGIQGVAHASKVIAAKFLNSFNVGGLSDALDANLYAAQNGARVLNNSWGNSFPTTEKSSLYDDAMEEIVKFKAIFIQASGNGDQYGRAQNAWDYYTGSEASLDLVNIVSSVAASGQISTFSNTGSIVDYSAPGQYILAPLASVSKQVGNPLILNERWIARSGTSMAAPFVSGVAAALLSSDPRYTKREVEYKMKLGVKDLGIPGKDDLYGNGLISLAGAMPVEPLPALHLLEPDYAAKVKGRVALKASFPGAVFKSARAYIRSLDNEENLQFLGYMNISSAPQFATLKFDSTTYPVGNYELVVMASGFTVGGQGNQGGSSVMQDQMVTQKIRIVPDIQPRINLQIVPVLEGYENLIVQVEGGKFSSVDFLYRHNQYGDQFIPFANVSFIDGLAEYTWSNWNWAPGEYEIKAQVHEEQVDVSIYTIKKVLLPERPVPAPLFVLDSPLPDSAISGVVQVRGKSLYHNTSVIFNLLAPSGSQTREISRDELNSEFGTFSFDWDLTGEPDRRAIIVVTYAGLRKVFYFDIQSQQ